MGCEVNREVVGGGESRGEGEKRGQGVSPSSHGMREELFYVFSEF